MKRVLVTGASGLIGREVLQPLLDAGFEVYAISRHTTAWPKINWITGNLFDDGFIVRTMRSVKPTHLLNLAWAATGDYLTSEENVRFLSAGVTLARAFAEVGGTRAVYAGSCLEYELRPARLTETSSLDVEKYAYTRCKDELRRQASEIFRSAGVSFCHGRIFYVFGRNEIRTRLTGLVIEKLAHGETVEIRSGPLRRDYVYSRDVAGAFVALLESRAEGVVNICTGRSVSIHDYVLTLAKLLGREDLVSFVNCCAGQPPLIVGDNQRLMSEVGFTPTYDVEDALREVVAASSP